MFLVVHGKHNPERDFQREYYAAVWNAVQETQILEKVVKIIAAQNSEQEIEKAKAVMAEIREAAAPIDVGALLDSREVIYAQVMHAPTAQHLIAVRLTPDGAASMEEGVKNLFGLIEKYSRGEVKVVTAEEGDASVTSLDIPSKIPFRPAVARIKDIFLFSSMKDLLDRSLKMMVSGEGRSKFDDPRLEEALQRLPEPEDALVFYDGKTQFRQMQELGEFIRQQKSGDPQVERIASLLDLLFKELAVLDYEVTVEYTEDNLNRSASYGKVMPGAEDLLLGKAFGSGKPFADWQTWIPAKALSYSLTTGVNLHPVYEGIVEVINEQIPEAQPGLQKFEAIQNELGVHLDRDILQAFSGESVSVAIPKAVPSLFGGGQDSVMALRCHKPDRIRELLHRAVEEMQKQPALKGQQLKLTECESLEGFEQLSMLGLAMAKIQPVIGFQDGWMYIGSNTRAIQKLLDTRSGQGDTIEDTDAFKQFRLNVEGPVESIKYSNLAESTKQISGLLNQAGMFAPMIIGMMNAEANAEELKPVQEIFGLLPSVGRIVSKFDFLQAQMTVIQDGDQPGTYLKRSVIVVQPPEPPETETETET